MKKNEILRFARFDKYLNVYNTLKPWLIKIDIFIKINLKMFMKEVVKILFIVSYLKGVIFN